MRISPLADRHMQTFDTYLIQSQRDFNDGQFENEENNSDKVGTGWFPALTSYSNEKKQP